MKAEAFSGKAHSEEAQEDQIQKENCNPHGWLLMHAIERTNSTGLRDDYD